MRLAASVAVLALAFAVPALADPAVPAGVAVKARGDGWWFVNDKGLVLYTYERDERVPGKSDCNAECAQAWPPLVAPADAKPVGDWSIITRVDNKAQWAYKGRPLYTYALEGGPGTSYGDGQGELWYAAYQPIQLPMEVTITRTLLGRVLADTRGMTVYTSDKDTVGGNGKPAKSACKDACLNTWHPVEAPIAASTRGDWSTVVREDGTKQWAYKGKPLYRYGPEDGPSETAGEGKGWHAAVLEPAPAYPAWTTIAHSDAGDLLATRTGQTIYTRNTTGGRRGFGAVQMCGDEPCLAPQWKPILADAEAKGEGNWSIATNKDGTKQWAYRGMKLYTNDFDKAPGDFKGIQFGGDRAWATIMRSGLPMQGVSVGGDYKRSVESLSKSAAAKAR